MRDVPISVSASGSEFDGNVESGALTPNAEINTHEHGWESSTKVSGMYRFPFDIMASGQFERRSGYFWARQVRFTGGRTIPNITLNVEPFDARQLPDNTQLDLRVEKSFSLGRGQRVAARANIFNVLELEHRARRDAPLRAELQQAHRHPGTAHHGVQHDVQFLGEHGSRQLQLSAIRQVNVGPSFSSGAIEDADSRPT